MSARRPHTDGMFDALFPFLFVLLAIYAWQAALRAKERARQFAHALCAEGRVQLLDQTVALQRIRFRRGEDGRLHWLRRYRFELSVNGSDRHQGSLDLMQDRLVAHSLPMLDAQTLDAIEPANEATVIAFPRRSTPH
ncbi:MAG TPA: DUF3301 domain-containing protein [Rudaea sp.]|nr:DUF3301 domain-containing protein [Rudaea sp.]